VVINNSGRWLTTAAGGQQQRRAVINDSGGQLTTAPECSKNSGGECNNRMTSGR